MTVTPQTPWRHIGRVPYEIWRKRIVGAGGLLEAAERDVWDACGDDSALMLEFLHAESSYASDFDAIPASKRNPWNLQIAGVGLTFASIREAALAWRSRLYDPTYKQGIYTRTNTIYELISTYAPKSDGNDPDGYARKVVDGMNRNGFDPPVTIPATPEVPLEQETPPVMTPATLDYSSLSFPVEVRLIPASQTNQRTGLAMTPAYTTWHDTDNKGRGANAESHARWMAEGCPDQYGRPTQTSWHFSVDDGKAIQHIPLNEVAWHAGDGYNGPGNRTSIAIEECVNSDRDAAKTRKNAAELHAFLIKKLGLQGGTVNALVQHNRWSGKNCPAAIRAAGLWPAVVAQTSTFLTAGGGTTPAYADAHPVEKGSRVINDHQFLAPGGKTFKRDTIPAEWGDGKDNPTGPVIKKGTTITQDNISHYVQGTDGNLYLVLTGVAGVADGSRVPADAVIA